MLPYRQARKALLLTRSLLANNGRNQYVRAGWSAARTVGASAKHAGHLLLLQVAGFFQAVFALIGGFAAVREFQKWEGGEIGPTRFLVAAAFGLIFLYFAASSFNRARRLTREKANAG